MSPPEMCANAMGRRPIAIGEINSGDISQEGRYLNLAFYTERGASHPATLAEIDMESSRHRTVASTAAASARHTILNPTRSTPPVPMIFAASATTLASADLHGLLRYNY